MNLQITGHHLDVTPAIREYIESKLERVLRHCDNVIDTKVMLSLEPLKHRAEITIRVRGKDLHCESSQDNLYAAIDVLMDKIDRQVIEYKNRAQNHAHEPAKRQIADNDVAS
jgi:putative sigma-54 modulation protein